MSDLVKIRRALLSVSDKTGLVEFAKGLLSHGVEILSTGGTAQLLKLNGVVVTEVGDYTGFPEMMEGRVKTLHPKVHGGILARRDKPGHVRSMEEHGIPPIDMVVVNLYPFQRRSPIPTAGWTTRSRTSTSAVRRWCGRERKTTNSWRS